jgi:hypothetical protein
VSSKAVHCNWSLCARLPAALLGSLGSPFTGLSLFRLSLIVAECLAHVASHTYPVGTDCWLGVLESRHTPSLLIAGGSGRVLLGYRVGGWHCLRCRPRPILSMWFIESFACRHA